MTVLKIFTSGLDYRPGFFWANLLPPNAAYVRVLVVAQNYERAVELVHMRGTALYAETLRVADPAELPSAALLAYVTRSPAPTPGVYALVRINEDVMGEPYAAPRFSVYEVTGGAPHALGRVRIVGMGRPTDPEPVAQVIDDDDQDDAVAMPADREGPIPADNAVSLALPYPPGRLGMEVRQAEIRIPRGIAEVRDKLTELLGDLMLNRLDANPAHAWQRGAGRLHELAQTLGGLQADAHLVEVTLRTGV